MYEKILRERVRVRNIRERHGTIFLRYYDFEPDFVRFNILTLRPGQKCSMLSVDLHPPLCADLCLLLEHAGFMKPELFGSLTLKGFNPSESDDLVIIARKNGKD